MKNVTDTHEKTGLPCAFHPSARLQGLHPLLATRDKEEMGIRQTDEGCDTGGNPAFRLLQSRFSAAAIPLFGCCNAVFRLLRSRFILVSWRSATCFAGVFKSVFADAAGHCFPAVCFPLPSVRCPPVSFRYPFSPSRFPRLTYLRFPTVPIRFPSVPPPAFPARACRLTQRFKGGFPRAAAVSACALRRCRKASAQGIPGFARNLVVFPASLPRPSAFRLWLLRFLPASVMLPARSFPLYSLLLSALPPVSAPFLACGFPAFLPASFRFFRRAFCFSAAVRDVF